MAKYNREIVSKIVCLIQTFEYTNFEVCQKTGISEATFYKWKNEKIEFLESIKKAEQARHEFYLNEAKKSLLKKIQGYDTTEIKETFEHSDGKDVLKERIITTKHIQPDTAAIIFTLTNRDPQRWKKDGGDKSDIKELEETPTAIIKLADGTEIEI